MAEVSVGSLRQQKTSMQVLIVDSSALIVHRLEEMLSEVAVITAIYSSVCYETALKICIEKTPAIVLIGIGLHVATVIDLVRKIKIHHYKTQVIVLSTDRDEYCYEQYQAHGIDYSLDKYRDFEKLPGIINSIASAGISSANNKEKTSI